MSITTTRQDLADSLKDAGYSVYAFPNEQMFAPCIVLVPGSPYIVWETPNRQSARFTLTLMVVANDNQAALINLEKMIETVIEALPTFARVGDFSQPAINEIGSTEFLTSDIEIDVVIN